VTKPLIKVRDLRKTFTFSKGSLFRKSIGQVVAVDDVNFDIKEGEILGCVGGSGSGKSTLGRAILRLIPSDKGSVTVDGVDLMTLSDEALRRRRREMQIVFQDPLYSLNPRRTVAENIARPLFNFKFPRHEIEERVRMLLGHVGLDPTHANRYPHEFSGGQCQRIGIARALALQPRFIFLDEPVSALDVSIQAQILNLLADLQEELNLTYLFVAHDLNIVRHFSHRILVLYHGRIVETGKSEEIYDNPKHPYTKTLLDSVLSIEGGDSWEKVSVKAGALADNEDVESAFRARASAQTGCIYAATCSERLEHCGRETPEFKEISPEHEVACHLY
jgi:peptide/nickel transport system ATP-binding protein/oligopeptide transport system ATP-binding protein